MKNFLNIKLFISLVLILSCQKTNWQKEPPEEFKGKFYLVAEEIIKGYRKPVSLTINDSLFQFYHYRDTSKNSLSIKKVGVKKDHVIIFCSKESDKIEGFRRYELSWEKDNYLYVYELAPTYITSTDKPKSFRGRYTTNKYFDSIE